MFRRILGLLMLLIGIGGIGIAILGAQTGHQLVSRLRPKNSYTNPANADEQHQQA